MLMIDYLFDSGPITLYCLVTGSLACVSTLYDDIHRKSPNDTFLRMYSYI
jgi:hypothetical protein